MNKQIKSYAFIDRKGNKITKEDYMTKKIGRAYGFFDCSASKTEIEGELPTIRDLIKTPAKLELILTEGVENMRLSNDKFPNGLIPMDFVSIHRKAKESGMRYVLEAKYEGATNKKTADELSAILNQAYQSPLYQNKEQFKRGIVYEEEGKYIFRE